MARLFDRTSIRSKVIAISAILLCCLGALDLIAMEQLAAVNEAVLDIRDHQVPGVRLLGDIAYQTMQFRSLEASFALASGRADRTSDIAAMGAARDQAEQSFGAWRLHAAAGTEVADDMWHRWQDYLVLHEQYLVFAQRGDPAGLASLYRGEMRTAFDDVQDALRRLTRTNVRALDDGTNAEVAAAGAAFAWIMGLIIIVSLLCLAIGWWLIRGVLLPITRMMQAVRRLAERDATTDIPGLARGDEIGAMAAAVRVFKDGLIEAARRDADRETAHTNEVHRLRQIADATFEGIIVHRDGVILHANAAFSGLLHRPDAAALRGHSLLEFVAPDSMDAARDWIWRRAPEPGELDIVRADGSTLPVELLSRSIDYEGAETMLAAVRDLSDRKRAEEKIRQLAFHDPLTCLPNRSLLNDRLTQALEVIARTGGRIAVLHLDLDRFKAVNDLLGHEMGDQVLAQVAARLSAAVRAMDTVARLGGDEFVVIQRPTEQPQFAAALARRLIEALSAPYKVDHQAVEIGVSIGIASYPDDGTSAPALLRNADIAMHRAKTRGRGQYQFFAAEMDQELRERHELQEDLREALAGQELELHYQPLYDCASRRLQGFEALLRWTHPIHGVLPPTRFIPIAEESNLILPLGRWVLEAACIEAASWPGAWSIAINLSPVQFQDRGLVDLVAGTLARTGLAAERLELEVTEGVLVGNPDLALDILTRLRGLGVRISLDDFGTGYSSLSYLHRFPFDKLKIDQSFIQNCDTNLEASGIVAAIIALGRCLHMNVIAEGVETEAQLRLLCAHHCDQAQGYLLGRPQPASQLAQFVTADAGGAAGYDQPLAEPVSLGTA